MEIDGFNKRNEQEKSSAWKKAEPPRTSPIETNGSTKEICSWSELFPRVRFGKQFHTPKLTSFLTNFVRNDISSSFDFVRSISGPQWASTLSAWIISSQILRIMDVLHFQTLKWTVDLHSKNIYNLTNTDVIVIFTWSWIDCFIEFLFLNP